eukprot:2488987-Prymnesium_polylepis.1
MRASSAPLGDPIKDARRVIDEMQGRDALLGAAARASIGSNGMVVGPLPGADRDSTRRSPPPRERRHTRRGTLNFFVAAQNVFRHR